MNTKNLKLNKVDTLLEVAKASGDAESLTALWKETLGLSQWHFITKQTSSIDERTPFIGVIDGRPWVFIFTDRQKAQEFGSHSENPGFTDDKGSVMIISQQTDKAIEYILELHKQGVYGIRINELNGWFSPIESLPDIIKHVNEA